MTRPDVPNPAYAIDDLRAWLLDDERMRLHAVFPALEGSSGHGYPVMRGAASILRVPEHQTDNRAIVVLLERIGYERWTLAGRPEKTKNQLLGEALDAIDAEIGPPSEAELAVAVKLLGNARSQTLTGEIDPPLRSAARKAGIHPIGGFESRNGWRFGISNNDPVVWPSDRDWFFCPHDQATASPHARRRSSEREALEDAIAWYHPRARLETAS
jgi:hypothetical protein